MKNSIILWILLGLCTALVINSTWMAYWLDTINLKKSTTAWSKIWADWKPIDDSNKKWPCAFRDSDYTFAKITSSHELAVIDETTQNKVALISIAEAKEWMTLPKFEITWEAYSKTANWVYICEVDQDDPLAFVEFSSMWTDTTKKNFGLSLEMQMVTEHKPPVLDSNWKETDPARDELVLSVVNYSEKYWKSIQVLNPTAFKELGTYDYHQLYARYKKDPNPESKWQWDAIDVILPPEWYTYNYAIFMPQTLDRVAWCSVSTIWDLTVSDMKCFPLSRQLEFKFYFLRLPQDIQVLFDDDRREAFDWNLNPMPKSWNEFLANYFTNQKTDWPLLKDSKNKYLSPTKCQNSDNICYKKMPDSNKLAKIWTYQKLLESELYNKFSDWLESYYQIDQETWKFKDENTYKSHCWNWEFKKASLVDCSWDPDWVKDSEQIRSYAEWADPTSINKIFDAKKIENLDKSLDKFCSNLGDWKVLSQDVMMVNAALIESNKKLADLSSRYEKFDACKKIMAIETLRNMTSRAHKMLSGEESWENRTSDDTSYIPRFKMNMISYWCPNRSGGFIMN